MSIGATYKCVLCCFTIAAFEASASTIYVDASASGSNNGSSWANAYTDLQSAITASTSGDEIWVVTGTYKPTSGTARTAKFQLKSGVGMYGGFVGTETLRSQRDWATNVTILSGDIGTVGVDTDNIRNVVYAINVNTSTVIDGFTIEGGYADLNSPNLLGTYGAGILCDTDCGLQANHLIVQDNWAGGGGGGIAIHNPVGALIDNSVIQNNFGLADAGGVAIFYALPSNTGTATLQNTEVTGNTCNFAGGGVDIVGGGGVVTVDNVSISNNTSNLHRGGGLEVNGPDEFTVHLQNLFISYNTAGDNTTFDGGGGLALDGGSISMTNITSYANSAHGAGGGLYVGQSPRPTTSSGVVIPWTNISLISNFADTIGGGVYFHHPNVHPVFVNASVHHNRANGSGGGIQTHATGLTTTYVTFVNSDIIYNQADADSSGSEVGGGANGDTSNSIKVSNCILWENSDSSGSSSAGAQITASGSTVQYSDVEGGWGGLGSGNINSDPLFVNAGSWIFHLDTGSPAIDTGNNSLVPGSVTTDNEGYSRFVNTTVDMGAYEKQ